MKQFYLVETTTRDKLIHQGIFFKPTNPGKKAILWVHGLTSTFYASLTGLEAFAEKCEQESLGFATFNNRGHDIITGLKKFDKRKPKGYTSILGGAGYENFRDCVYDIESGINFLISKRFTEIVLVGHSTGANKVCYYAATKKSPHVIGVVLAAPTSDRASASLDKIKLEKDLAHMQDLINQGKGDEPVSGHYFFPLTPKRFMSLFTANSREDTFDYQDPRPRLIYFSKIKKPLLLILAEKDETLDRSVRRVKEVFDAHQKSTNYRSIIIPDALHSFNGKEEELAKEIIEWTKSL